MYKKQFQKKITFILTLQSRLYARCQAAARTCNACARVHSPGRNASVCLLYAWGRHSFSRDEFRSEICNFLKFYIIKDNKLIKGVFWQSVSFFQSKGRLISKGLFCILNSPKKLDCYNTSVRLVFVRFLDEIEDTNNRFRNYLTFSKVIKKLCISKFCQIPECSSQKDHSQVYVCKRFLSMTTP